MKKLLILLSFLFLLSCEVTPQIPAFFGQHNNFTCFLECTFTYVNNYQLGNAQWVGMFMRSNGASVYILTCDASPGGASYIFQYNLSTAWDITSASLLGYATLASGNNYHQFHINPDGNKLYMINETSGVVEYYTMSTAWNITTLSGAGSFTVYTYDDEMHGLTFSSDGTRMFTCGWENDDIYQFNLSTPWTITSGVTYSTNLSVSSTPFHLNINEDGTRLIYGTATTYVQYYLYLSDELSSADLFCGMSVGTSYDYGCYIDNDELKFYYINDYYNRIYEYNISEPF